MGILGRLLLLLYVLAVMVALVVSAGVCLHFIPAWQNNLQWIVAREETLYVLAIMFLASICLLIMALSSGKKKVVNVNADVALQKGTPNEVRITVPAIVGIIERATLNVVGVRQASAEVFNQEESVPFKAKVSIILGQNYSAPEISSEVRAAINSALKTALQVSDVPIDIQITEVNHAANERERRVV